MKKRKSTRENMTQTAVWLPRDMHEQLKKAGGERGLGEEIRRQIKTALDAASETPSDEITGKVLAQITDIIQDLSRDEPWYSNRFVFEALKAAIETLLAKHQPDREAKSETKARLQALYGDEKPEIIGRIIALAAIHAYDRKRIKKAFLRDQLKG